MKPDDARMRGGEETATAPAEQAANDESPGRRPTLKPAPISLDGIGINEQPRVGPLPPTPKTPSTHKRKAPSALVIAQEPFYRQKKRLMLGPSPNTTIARRAGLDNLEITMNDQGGAATTKTLGFPFTKLPGEIRNMIYDYCIEMSTKQALLMYLPKTSSLRSSTRKGRIAAGKYSEIDVSTNKGVAAQNESEPDPPEVKESNRPFMGLTQVCQGIRKEFYPLYIANQEIGLDLTSSAKYVETFFNPNVPLCFADNPDPKEKNMPFRGNITIAVADKVLAIEKTVGYIDVLPLLYTWANSAHIEAGFGRYSRYGYHPATDGEAKDMYRLYGRRVLQDRTCSDMNKSWRVMLRERRLAAVRVHRKQGAFPRPYFHVILKYEHRERWMTDIHSTDPDTILYGAITVGRWAWKHGFAHLEFFDVRVGAERFAGEFAASSHG